MAKPAFIIKVKTGWRRLDDILERIQNAINERTPLASETIDLDEQPNGIGICVKPESSTSGTGDTGGGGGGDSSNLYGALNGAPATFHLLQSSPPTPL